MAVGAEVSHEVLVPGRAVRSVFHWRPQGYKLVVYNLHVWGFTWGEILTVQQAMQGDQQLARDSPLGHVVFAGGDFNFLPQGEL
eukprot:7105459-Karenia_brevis.AAC.1